MATAQATIMTFNLRRATVLDGANAWRYRKSRAAEAIRAGGADFVGTQEGFRRMLQELTSLLPGYAYLGEGRKGGGADEHNAILYREDAWAPERSGTFWLSETPDAPGSRGWGSVFPRICTWALFRRVDDPDVRVAVFNTHLDHISANARKRGAALVADRLRDELRTFGGPAVMIGDFNAKPHSEAICQLSETYRLISAYDVYPGGTKAAGATYHGFRGGGARGEPIDYIFAAGADCELRLTAVHRAKVRGKFPSDHYPVSTTVSWRAAEARDEGGGR